MSRQFFRLRSIDSLLGEYNELDSQTIYFADPSHLNDPMEGYRNIYWHGDSIIWKNFLKHFLLCLERFCSSISIVGETDPIAQYPIPVFESEEDLPTPQYKAIFKEICSNFFENESVQTFVQMLSSRKVHTTRNELYSYLRTLQITALDIIFDVYSSHGLTKENVFQKQNYKVKNQHETFKLMHDLDKNNEHVDIYNALFLSVTKTMSQLDLIHLYNQNKNKNNSYNNLNFLLLEFVEKYLNSIEKLIYPEWYVACFMSEHSITNSSMWANYGDNHKGACLIFNSEMANNKHSISLNQITGYGSSEYIHGNQKHHFREVDYIQGNGEVDFFRSIGTLPIAKLKENWYSEKGKVSVSAEGIFEDENNWRKNYWDNFNKDILKKTQDWEFEDEYRIILSSHLNMFDEKKNRLLKYDFESLDGIIFGINTSTENKLEIMKIIDEKCTKINRENFKFYQARYSTKDRCVVKDEMTLINFTKRSPK